MFLESVFPDKYYSKYTPPTILDPDPNDLVLFTNKAKKLAMLILDHWAVDVPFTHHPQATADGLLRSCLEQCRAYYKPQIVRWLKNQTEVFFDLSPRGKKYHFSRKSIINCLVSLEEDSDLIKVAITPVHNWSEPAKVSFDSLEETLASILWHFHAAKIQKVDQFEWDPFPEETRPKDIAIVGNWFNVSGFLFEPAPDLSSTAKEYERMAAALETHSERLIKAISELKSTSQEPSIPPLPHKPYHDPDNQERNEWFYHRASQGATNKQLIKELEAVCSEKKWNPVSSANAIRTAIKTITDFHGWPVLNRQTGRPKTPK